MSNNILRQPQLQVETEELKRLRARLLPPYRVILYDDDYNEMNYVVFVLLHCINNLTQAEAERIMLTAHLKAVLTKESEHADKLLTEALAIAEEAGCDAVAEVVQAREAGSAIVDEARDHNCALILLGMVRDSSKVHNDLGKTVPYVLTNAPCRVWVVMDPLQRGS